MEKRSFEEIQDNYIKMSEELNRMLDHLIRDAMAEKMSRKEYSAAMKEVKAKQKEAKQEFKALKEAVKELKRKKTK